MKAFSLIELLIVIAIIVIIGAVVQVNFQSFQKQSDLTTLSQNIIAILRKAQSNSIESKNFSRYGVHFQSDAYTLFKGNTYNPINASNEQHPIPDELEIFPINVGGGSDVIFERIDGRTANAGTIQLRMETDPSASSTIIIEPSGNVSAQKNISLANTRITDSRHIHFNLGWSIQGAVTLTLAFKDPPNPDTAQNIPMASYFTSPTQFNWEGTTSVGGQNQRLQVATHSLSATSTLLTIIRDARDNTKAVDISIDGKAIISYSALGNPSVGLWGGIMQIQ